MKDRGSKYQLIYNILNILKEVFLLMLQKLYKFLQMCHIQTNVLK